MAWPTFLMQFNDGLRIDLTFFPGNAQTLYESDTLSRVLLDKDRRITVAFQPNEGSYLTKKPKEEEYAKEVNEFFWCMLNVGKGLKRKELTYSRFMYECYVRESFLKIAAWFLGSRHGWTINTGKYGKFLRRYADDALWAKIEATYPTDTEDADGIVCFLERMKAGGRA